MATTSLCLILKSDHPLHTSTKCHKTYVQNLLQDPFCAFGHLAISFQWQYRGRKSGMINCSESFSLFNAPLPPQFEIAQSRRPFPMLQCNCYDCNCLLKTENILDFPNPSIGCGNKYEEILQV